MEPHTLEYHLLIKLIKRLSVRSMNRFEHNVGAIIVDKKGQILSWGFNSYTKTHVKQYLYNKDINSDKIYLHAEISSLVKCSTLDSCAHTMIIARLGKDRKVHLAKPCKGCTRAIIDSGLKKVFYTNELGNLELLQI